MDLHVYESGPASAPAILFLHGSPLSGAMWRPQMAGLSEFHCLAPDLPEHGQSAGVGPFEMADTVRRLVDIIRSLTKGGRAHVVGLSFGGVVAQALMVHAPAVVDHAVLSGTAARMGKALQALLRVTLAANRPLLSWLRPEQLAALVRFQFGLPPDYDAMVARDLAVMPAARMVRFVMDTYTRIETPTEARVPVLVAVGQKETAIARMMARQLVAEIAGARGVMAPQLGHAWNLQAPDLFCDMVRAWVMDRALPAGLEAL
jgi:pimeloyl-ACP methyl ester carboxylesterase